MDLSSFSSVLDWIATLGTPQKWAFATLMIVVSLVISKYIIVRAWLHLVKYSSPELGAKLEVPIANRLYAFVLAAGIHFSAIWVFSLDPHAELTKQMMTSLNIAYILLGTSLTSVSAKHAIPFLMAKLSSDNSVTISGSNPLFIFLFRAVLWFGGIYLALSEVGIELFGLMASLAVFSIIIGLAMQQTLGNIINSFMLAIDQPFEVGDRIEVEGVVGSVVSVGILSTKLLTFRETLVVIPNNTLINSTVINHARGGGGGVARRFSVVIDIGVDYAEDTDHVKHTLLQLSKECPYALEEPGPRVLLNDFTDFAKIFRVYCSVNDYSDEWVTRDWLLKSIDERFSEEGIGIPYPTSLQINKEFQATIDSRKKNESVANAKKQMIKEEMKMQEAREEMDVSEDD